MEFGIVNGSINTGDFLINGTIPPVILQPPFQSSYLLLIVTGNQVDAINRTNITFDLYSMINTTSGMAMPQATVILQLPGTVNNSNVLYMLSQLPKIFKFKIHTAFSEAWNYIVYSFYLMPKLHVHSSSGCFYICMGLMEDLINKPWVYPACHSIFTETMRHHKVPFLCAIHNQQSSYYNTENFSKIFPSPVTMNKYVNGCHDC